MCIMSPPYSFRQFREYMDRVYTPSFLAQELVAAVAGPAFDYIADFAAGRGALLAAAAARWPDAQVVANDRDGRASNFLGREYPRWTVLCSDLFDMRDRKLQLVFRRIAEKRTLLLLNPPFSCRGAQRYSIDVAGNAISCSLALAFVLRAAAAASASGSEIACVLPAGSLSAEKDVRAWEYLRKRFAVEVVGAYERFTFPGYHPRTAAVRLVRTGYREEDRTIDAGSTSDAIEPAGFVRGWVQMHSKDLGIGSRCLRLVHTTDMQNGTILLSNDWIWTDRCFSGPGVLVPRVGQPRRDKIVICTGSEDVALSDCVIGVRSATVETARGMRDRMLARWETLERCYTGTGARYITLNKLAAFLRTCRQR
jgi:predicted RNA methylase